MTSLRGGGGEIVGSTTARAGDDQLKSQFTTREGTYRLVSAVDFSRPTRPVTYVQNNSTPAPGTTSPPVRLSFVTVPDDPSSSSSGDPGGSIHSGSGLTSPGHQQQQPQESSVPDESNLDLLSSNHRFCFNMGKDLFVFPFMGCRKMVDINKPIDKRGYKGTNPTCHDFNAVTASRQSLPLLIGFSGGQIQLVDPIYKDVNVSKLFNEERLIEKSRVTCIRWVPKSPNLFLVAHASGNMYLYNETYTPCGTTPPHYQMIKSGPGYTVWNCKNKTPRNPVTRWALGDGAVNEFSFSPCGQFLAVVSQDGFLRIFRYETHELVGLTRSYFGGLICVGWSPDGKYICVGGEDDLVTLWSFKERRVVARGQGHKSWVAVVAFDPYTTTYDDTDFSEDNCGEEDASRNPQNNDCHYCHSSGVISCDSVSATTGTANNGGGVSMCASCQQNEKLVNNHNNSNNFVGRNSRYSRTSENMRLSTSESTTTRIPACYRVGSVGQDTQLCLWDLTEDVIKQPFGKTRPASRAPGELSPYNSNSKPCRSHHQQHILHSTANSSNVNSSSNNALLPNGGGSPIANDEMDENSVNLNTNHSASGNNSGGVDGNFICSNTTTTNGNNPENNTSSSTNGNNSTSHNTHTTGHSILSLRFGGLSFGADKSGSNHKDKEHKRNFSLSSSKIDKNNAASSKSVNSMGSLGLGLSLEDPMKLIGTRACPRLDECPLLEPLVCKKISHERLTSLTFREESIVTACQDAIVCTWARPGDQL